MNKLLSLLTIAALGLGFQAGAGEVTSVHPDGQIEKDHVMSVDSSSTIKLEDAKILHTNRHDMSLMSFTDLTWGSHFDWGQGRNGFGYCYEWTNDGRVLNGGAAQPDFYCDRTNPSRYTWGQGRNGYGYCYQYTPYGVVMNEGQAQNNYSCERYYPSSYNWGYGRDGNVYCYQYTPYGAAMNEGAAQPNYLCQ